MNKFSFFLTLLLLVSGSAFLPTRKINPGQVQLSGKQKQSIIAQMTKPKVVTKYADVVIQPSYNVASGFALVGLTLSVITESNFVHAGGIFLFLVGLFLYKQTGVVRFVFDGEALEIKKQFGKSSELLQGGENFAVGGRNRWNYSTFKDWSFIPSVYFPILFYFMETRDSPKGQFHLFPVILVS